MGAGPDAGVGASVGTPPVRAQLRDVVAAALAVRRAGGGQAGPGDLPQSGPAHGPAARRRGRAPRTWQAPVIIIDGRSGAGKTCLSLELARRLRAAGIRGVQVAHLDDWYPGWSGLAAGTSLTDHLLTTWPAYPEWDWDRARVRRWVRLDPRRPLVVEGSGALTARTRAASDVRVWVDVAARDEGAAAAATERRRRALDRDGEGFRPWWEMWARQEERHLARHHPRRLADLEVLT